jgi:hypothetical protein
VCLRAEVTLLWRGRRKHTGTTAPCALGVTGARARGRPRSSLKHQTTQNEPPFCTPTQQPACSCREKDGPVWLARAHPDVLPNPAPLSSTVSRKRHLVSHLGDCRTTWGGWVGGGAKGRGVVRRRGAGWGSNTHQQGESKLSDYIATPKCNQAWGSVSLGKNFWLTAACDTFEWVCPLVSTTAHTTGLC